MTQGAERNTVKSVSRAMALLTSFTPDEPELGLMELSRRAGLHKSTVHRLLVTLEKSRFIEQNPETGCYRLGIKVFELGTIFASQFDVRKLARPVIGKLARLSGETVQLAVVSGNQLIYLDKIDAPHSEIRFSDIGRHAHFTTTAVGKAALAVATPRELEYWLGSEGFVQRTKRSITSKSDLLEELSRTRARGYSIDNEENEDGVRCVGAAFFNSMGKVVGSVSVAAVTPRLTSSRMNHLGCEVAKAAEEISRRLGFDANRQNGRGGQKECQHPGKPTAGS